MKIEKQQVQYVASLARLKISAEEENKFIDDMSAIIDFADKLNELDASGVSPTAQAIAIENVYREDIVKPSYDRDEILKNAPSKEDGCYLVPKIVE